MADPRYARYGTNTAVGTTAPPQGGPEQQDPMKNLKGRYGLPVGFPAPTYQPPAQQDTPTQMTLTPKTTAPTGVPAPAPAPQTQDPVYGKGETFLPNQYTKPDDPIDRSKTGGVDEGYGQYAPGGERPTQEGLRGPGAFDPTAEAPPAEITPFQDPETKALSQQHERDVARMSYQGMQEARAIAAKRGYAPGSEQYNALMREAKAQINDATLRSQRGVFGTIRERGQEMRDEILQNAPASVQAFLAGKPLAEQKAFMDKITDPETGKLKEGVKDVNFKTLAQRHIYNAQAKFPGIADQFKDENGVIDYDAFYNHPQVREFVDGKVSDQIDAMADPLDEAGKKRQEQKAREERISNFTETGDYSQMTTDDWKNMTDQQKADAKKHVTNYEDAKPTTPWKEDQSISTADAKQKWASSNPLGSPDAKGKLVEKDGVMYIITDPQAVSSSKQWEMGTYQTRNHLIIKARPVDGGPEIELYKSTEFDPD